jgi:hypothetical protein
LEVILTTDDEPHAQGAVQRRWEVTPEAGAAAFESSIKAFVQVGCGKVFLQPYQGITDGRSLSWALRHHWFRSAAQSG